MYRRHDYFYDIFMQQRIQKLNNFEHPSLEDSHQFPIEPLRTVPVTVPQKGVSNTNSDSGVNFLHVLSPAMPVKPDIPQPYLIPSTSRMNPSTEPLTPIQQFIYSSPKPKANEPKYNCSQPDHPDPQSVLRTHTRQGYKL